MRRSQSRVMTIPGKNCPSCAESCTRPWPLAPAVPGILAVQMNIDHTNSNQEVQILSWFSHHAVRRGEHQRRQRAFPSRWCYSLIKHLGWCGDQYRTLRRFSTQLGIYVNTKGQCSSAQRQAQLVQTPPRKNPGAGKQRNCVWVSPAQSSPHTQHPVVSFQDRRRKSVVFSGSLDGEGMNLTPCC